MHSSRCPYRLRLVVVALASLATLTACGGGGGSANQTIAVDAVDVSPAGVRGPATPPSPVAPPVSTPTPAPAPPVDPAPPSAPTPPDEPTTPPVPVVLPTPPAPTPPPVPTTPPAPPVAPPTSATPTCGTLPGANVSGGEFGSAVPGRHGYDYIYPQQAEIDLLKRLDLRLMRVPFLWERLQHAASTALDADELQHLDDVVALATTAGITVVLDAHNYGYYQNVQLAAGNASPTALPDLWSRVAAHYASNPNVAFGIMNEPHDIDIGAWAPMVERTLAAIRATGATNTVMIPGTNWDGASSWQSPLGTQSNASALLPIGVNDPHVVFEVHQYFDTGYSGTQDTCTAAAGAKTALADMSTWARANHVKLFLGEFGVSQRPECVAALDEALTIVETNQDVWFGYTYWAAGAWWGNYSFNIEIPGGTPQGAVLRQHAAMCPAS